MTSQANCLICGKKVKFTNGNPIELAIHMMEAHKSGSVCQYSVPDNKSSLSKQTISQKLSECKEACKKRAVSLKRGSSRNRKSLYKTTLETWSAGYGVVVCPNCNKEVKPLIRSQRNKVAYNSIGATFLLSCWPFCFLFPMMHKCAVDLYCPLCKCKLGVGDSLTGKSDGITNVPNIQSCQL